ncbi:MAG: hypothetical protein D6714_05850 [Bacteroidetes bacterium]|nr:MAG: hypothetical protein D6714_05850 [Bacteroidota bacterium]
MRFVMKINGLFFTIMIVLFGISLQAQEVSEGDRSMSQGVNHAYILKLPDAEPKLVQKLWKDFIKDYKGRVKKVKKSDDYLAEGCKIPDINGSSPVNVYSRIEKNGAGSEVIVWYDLGDGNFLSNEGAADRMLNAFALFVKKEQTKMELEAEQKELKQLENELKKLAKANENYHKEIEKAEEAIRKAKENIEINLKEQENTKAQIEAQKEVIEEVRKRLSKI